MDRERAVVVDVSRALYAAAERLPSGSPWIGAFCEIAQLMEGGEPQEALSAQGAAPSPGNSGPRPHVFQRGETARRSQGSGRPRVRRPPRHRARSAPALSPPDWPS